MRLKTSDVRFLVSHAGCRSPSRAKSNPEPNRLLTLSPLPCPVILYIHLLRLSGVMNKYIAPDELFRYKVHVSPLKLKLDIKHSFVIIIITVIVVVIFITCHILLHSPNSTQSTVGLHCHHQCNRLRHGFDHHPCYRGTDYFACKPQRSIIRLQAVINAAARLVLRIKKSRPHVNCNVG